MSDDLEGVSREEAGPAAARSERDAMQAELESLIACLESTLGGLRTLARWIWAANPEALPFDSDRAARREAEARAEKAELQLQRSVDTNIGRQRTIQKLRKRVQDLEQALEAQAAGEGS